MARVKVPQSDGEISVSYSGDDPKVYAVSSGTVQVDDADVARFLSAVEGSSLEDAKPASAGKE